MLNLTPRLQSIYDHLSRGVPVWDVCCDHGYLGLKAYEAGHFPEIYFVDRVSKIIQNLKARFDERFHSSEKAVMTHFFALRAEDISQQVYGNLVISGVGAHTTHNIISNLQRSGFLRAEKLILIPQNHEAWLLEAILKSDVSESYQLEHSHKIIENGRQRNLFVFKRI